MNDRGSGERRLGISVPMARRDDDDIHICMYIYGGARRVIKQSVEEKENSEFKPVELHKKLTLCYILPELKGLVNTYIDMDTHTYTHTHTHTHIYIYIYIYHRLHQVLQMQVLILELAQYLKNIPALQLNFEKRADNTTIVIDWPSTEPSIKGCTCVNKRKNSGSRWT